MTSKTRILIWIAVFPAMMAATAGIAIPFAGLPPITLQTLFVYLAGLLLNWKHAATAMFVYVLLGTIGLPIFSNYRGGLEVLVGSSGGFLIGFILVAGLIAFFKNVIIINKPFWDRTIILFGATTILYLIGASYIAVLYDMNYWLVLGGFYLYLPGDIVKIVVASYVHVRIRSHVTYESS